MISVSPQPVAERCTPEQRVTRALLGYGIVAGPFYVAVSLTQAVLREGFDLTRHPWSLLANGPAGWIQITNLILTGLMVTAAAVGYSRALRGGIGRRWVPILLATYGISLIGAGVFRADPMDGFPVGTPAGPPVSPTLSALLHLAFGGVGFLAMIIATLVLARRFRQRETTPPRRGQYRHRRGLPGGIRRNRLRIRITRSQPRVHRRRPPDLGLAEQHLALLLPQARLNRFPPLDRRSKIMRYLVLLKASSTPDTPPPPDLMAAIMTLGEEAKNAGVLVDTQGLHPSPAGTRVSLTSGRLTATDGPFTESKELISYALYEVRAKEDAVEWTNRFLKLHHDLWPGWEGEADVLKVFGPEDFAPPTGDPSDGAGESA